MLIGYFDESGHSSGTDFVALAAFVAAESEWKQFDNQWQSVLKKNNAPYLHMREFAHFRGPFEGWTEKSRRTFLEQCVITINSFHAIAIGAVMAVENFAILNNNCQLKLQDPFFVAFKR